MPDDTPELVVRVSTDQPPPPGATHLVRVRVRQGDTERIFDHDLRVVAPGESRVDVDVIPVPLPDPTPASDERERGESLARRFLEGFARGVNSPQARDLGDRFAQQYLTRFGVTGPPPAPPAVTLGTSDPSFQQAYAEMTAGQEQRLSWEDRAGRATVDTSALSGITAPETRAAWARAARYQGQPPVPPVDRGGGPIDLDRKEDWSELLATAAIFEEDPAVRYAKQAAAAAIGLSTGCWRDLWRSFHRDPLWNWAVGVMREYCARYPGGVKPDPFSERGDHTPVLGWVNGEVVVPVDYGDRLPSPGGPVQDRPPLNTQEIRETWGVGTPVPTPASSPDSSLRSPLSPSAPSTSSPGPTPPTRRGRSGGGAITRFVNAMSRVANTLPEDPGLEKELHLIHELVLAEVDRYTRLAGSPTTPSDGGPDGITVGGSSGGGGYLIGYDGRAYRRPDNEEFIIGAWPWVPAGVVMATTVETTGPGRPVRETFTLSSGRRVTRDLGPGEAPWSRR